MTTRPTPTVQRSVREFLRENRPAGSMVGPAWLTEPSPASRVDAKKPKYPNQSDPRCQSATGAAAGTYPGQNEIRPGGVAPGQCQRPRQFSSATGVARPPTRRAM